MPENTKEANAIKAQEAKDGGQQQQQSKAAQPRLGEPSQVETPSDGFTNPVLKDQAVPQPVYNPDASSNPAAFGPNDARPNPAPGVVQTTIDSETTSINPKTSIHNRVEPSVPGESVEKVAERQRK